MSRDQYLEIPQTPRSKKKFDDDSDEDSVDGLVMEEVGRKTSGATLLVPGNVRSRSTSPFSQRDRASPAPRRFLVPTPTEKLPRTWKSSLSRSWQRFWERNRSVILVAAAQLFGALMNLCARLLELDGEGMHPFQILFVRMSITTVCSCAYMYYTKVPHFPLGARDVRILLVARGVTGFVSPQP